MTLIVLAATTDHILQAVDRRLTRGQPIRETRDDETKAVVFCGSAIFAYTGRAYIDDEQTQRTDHWLCNALAGSCHLVEQLPVLKARADGTFGHRREPLAFAATAWGSRDGAPSPFLALVSNFHDPKTGKQTTAVKPSFEVLVRELRGSEKTLLHCVGAEVEEAEDDELEGIISGLSSHMLTPDQALGQMTQVLGRIAERDATVGQGVLLTVIPKDTELGLVLATSLYLPADSAVAVGKTPHFVCGGAQIIEARFAGDGASTRERCGVEWQR